MSSLPADRSIRKRLGAWYTPDSLVASLVAWGVRTPDDVILDPSVGDGQFLRESAGRLRSLGWNGQSAPLFGVDINLEAVRSTQQALDHFGVPAKQTRLRTSDFFQLQPPGHLFSDLPPVDVVIGNPPYVRYQTVDRQSRDAAIQRARDAGAQLTNLSSSWAPFVIHAATFLKKGGRLGLVLPEELVHASYAMNVRSFLRRHFHTTTVVGFEDYLFPGSQERVVLLLAEGRGVPPFGRLRLASARCPEDIHSLETAISKAETFPPDACPAKWERHFDDDGAKLLDRLREKGVLAPLREVGKAGIGYVSGANDFFVLSPAEARRRRFPSDTLRSTVIAARQVSGAVFSHKDFRSLAARDERCWLWNGAGTARQEVRRYIEEGVSQGVSGRYKCRKREPWFIVPGVTVPDAFLTYMSDVIPRLVLNQAKASCSNNLLSVRLDGVPAGLRRKFVAAFYNSATMLSIERIGRRYGGGVLKLEPSEADRILVPHPRALKGDRRLAEILDPIDASLRDRRGTEALALVDPIVLGKIAGLTVAEIRIVQESRLRRQESRVKTGARRTFSPVPDARVIGA